MSQKRRKRTGRNGIGKGLGIFLKKIGSLFLRAFPFFACVGLAGVLFFGVREALFADFNLNIEEIRVDPPQALPIAKRQELEAELIGKNILQVDLRKISAGLERNPAIADARIVRQLPSLLIIHLIPRTPMALIQFSPHGRYGVIAEDGMILDVLKARDSSLPLVEAYGIGRREPEVGFQVANLGFYEAIDFIKAYGRHALAQKENIVQVRFDHLGNVSVVFMGGPEIRLGRRPVERFEALEKVVALLAREDRRLIEYIDLQFGNVIVKRKR